MSPPKTKTKNLTGRHPILDYIATLPKPIRQIALSMSQDWNGHTEPSLTFTLQTLKHHSMNDEIRTFWQQVYEHYRYGAPMPSVTGLLPEEDYSLDMQEGMTAMEIVRQVFYKYPDHELTSLDVEDLLDRRNALTPIQIRVKLSYLKSNGEIQVTGKKTVRGLTRKKNYKLYKLAPDEERAVPHVH